VYRRILGPVYDKEKKKTGGYTDIYAIVKKNHYNRDSKVT
jgi:hypothetical protein